MNRKLTHIALGALLALPLLSPAAEVVGGKITTDVDFAARFNKRVLPANATDNTITLVDQVTPTENRTADIRLVSRAQGVANAADISIKADVITDTYHWYGFSIYFPDTWTPSAAPVTVAQIDAGNGLPPPVAFVVRNDEIMLNLSANHRNLTGGDSATVANTQTRTFVLDKLPKNQWVCVVLSVNWSAALRNGDFGVYLNDQPVRFYTTDHTPNTYVGATHTLRVGLSANQPLGVSERNIRAAGVWAVRSNGYPELLQNSMPCKNYV